MPRKWKTNPDSVDQGASSIARDQITQLLGSRTWEPVWTTAATREPSLVKRSVASLASDPTLPHTRSNSLILQADTGERSGTGPLPNFRPSSLSTACHETNVAPRQLWKRGLTRAGGSNPCQRTARRGFPTPFRAVDSPPSLHLPLSSSFQSVYSLQTSPESSNSFGTLEGEINTRLAWQRKRSHRAQRGSRRIWDLKFVVASFRAREWFQKKRRGEGKKENGMKFGRRKAFHLAKFSKNEGIFFIENNGFRYIARSKKNEYRGRGSLGWTVFRSENATTRSVI